MTAQVAERTEDRRPRLELVPAPQRTVNLDPIANQWQRALDADSRALGAVKGVLQPDQIGTRTRALAQERHETKLLLSRLARTTGAQPAPWLADTPLTARSIGLPGGAEACIFDLDGVLTDSGVLHAWAWAQTFDPLLQRLAERADLHFVPFDRESDYRAFVDGRPRLEGIHSFLASRGIRLPEGRPGDGEDAETAYGLARRKSNLLARELHIRGVTSLDGASRYLEAVGRAGLGRAVVSASSRTLPMLQLAHLDGLVEQRVDADAIRAENLRPRPAPDLLVAACTRLGVDPQAAVTLTHTEAGVVAGHAAGLAVIGVAEGEEGERLGAFGAERVVDCLGVLLDRRLISAGR
jgi:beta-phosphoglucomutase-like phosphatase (HAD superfamily)